ncbi:MAG: ATP synthase epsilon chain [Candidatus Woesebacteria bacterium GW2011_GWA1_39_21]|uniref:ATP synthase epsilon chain n=1 Tax=Candidatus Woesebacteria bacterium GW2011_GWA1_39_21 TaxID=1618550 RepID=A0A0G0NEX3_9BACT|nr:MAG: ATP synthase epsilon chain [Candidatus Woesebacteria bacterium GW2011_GWA1_39_21]
MRKLKLSVISPEQKVFELGDIDSITFPTGEGEITVLPEHVPLVSQIVTGEIVIRLGSKDESIVTTEGFLKLDSKGNAVVLADYAIRSDDLELAKVEEAKRKAETAMKENLSKTSFAVAEAELKRTLLELKISQRRKRSGKVNI